MMKIKVYDLAEIPAPRRRSGAGDLQPYFDALKAGRAAGDGAAYDSQADAAKAALRSVVRARRLAKGTDVPYPGTRVWQDRGGKWFWALVPSRRRSRG